MAWISGSVIFDGPNKLIIAVSGTTVLRVKEDLYSDWKEWIVDTGSNARYLPAFDVIGGQPIGGGEFAGSNYFLINGWKLRPDERTHQLTVDGNIFTDDQTRITSPVTGAFTVEVQIRNSALPTAIETSSDGALTLSQSIQLQEIWRIHGLDTENSMSVSDTLRVVADIIQDITLVNNTASIQRQ